MVRADSALEATQAVTALVAGGITTVEITLIVPQALQVIGELRARYDTQVIVGAGTVLDVQAAQECIDAGAQFIVSPACDVEMVKFCNERQVAVFPGALTPTEIVAAWRAGADAVKLFPADALGGAKYLKSLKAPLPQIELMPTGGVTLENVAEFIHAGAFALGVGANLVDVKSLRANKASELTTKAQAFVRAVQTARDGIGEVADAKHS